MKIHQAAITHEICCLAAQWSMRVSQLRIRLLRASQLRVSQLRVSQLRVSQQRVGQLTTSWESDS